ncbi:MAG: aconitate hydratase AcnA [Chloroflexi bacterium]|nr:aconitate hydratase AcnA [Chloroflexota bacterium]MCI0808243.1 aconitate hydratase AcnA [Chloroflexota bacterium]MCI0836359.1 aconitate hydratase AcnA [Chloroflexota bacterium]MCI0850835.1 aconitate hydratase AcnA [Chloroflexota bacterium]
MSPDSTSFDARRSFETANGTVNYYSLAVLEDAGLIDIAKTPYSIRVLLENALRKADGGPATGDHVKLVASWRPDAKPAVEFPYMPGRVVLQDFTGIPVVVDIAAMRDAVSNAGGDASIINPVVRSDLVIDHSVQVDYFSSSGALAMNIEREFERNNERYQLLKWAQGAFDNLKIIPPGAGIVHQVNLEFLAEVVLSEESDYGRVAFPDTCIGTDSHTTMVNGLGVLGWGVGGIEAEAVMLGQPYYMVVPEVVGVRLSGTLPEGATATDLVLGIVEVLRAEGVVEKFVEFYGPGLAALPVADRATIGNMAPEYGATCGFFPIDDQTLKYLRDTGRDDSVVELVEKYAKANSFFYDPANEPDYTVSLEFNLDAVVPSMAGPKRPQDRIALSEVGSNFVSSFEDASPDMHEIDIDGEKGSIGDGSVVIAAITSCTNTSNPSVMVGAGLLARNARNLGLTSKPWVKTSLAPGSTVVTRYLEAAGLNEDLDALGFNTVGYGCTTCIGNSGPLPQAVSDAVNDHDLTAAAVLSGNRNFEGRVHPQVKANYLASPLLVIAYALVGQVDVDLVHSPIGQDRQGGDVFLKDIWPSQADIADTIAESLTADMFREQYSQVFDGSSEWQALPAPTGLKFNWDPQSTYVQEPPYFEDFGDEPTVRSEIVGARVLVGLGDSVTTDHISPAGAIPPSAPAGQFLLGNDVPRREFNSFGSRRGNHNVMVRGTFGNIRLRNKLTPELEGDWTIHQPDGEQMRIFEASEKYLQEGVPLIILAGKEYGTGSSRDWAAKGPMLLGVRAVIAESFERIHRSNLIGMGVIPLVFTNGDSADSLGLDGTETYDIPDVANSVVPGSTITVTATSDGGNATTFEVLVRIDTGIENEYYRNGGLLPYVLRQMMADG